MNHSITKLLSIEFIGQAVGKGFEYGLTILIARTLGADGLGAFAFGLVVLRLSGAVARLGLDTAAQKFIPLQTNEYRRLTGTVLICLLTPFIVGIAVVIVIFISAREFGISLDLVTKILLFGIPVFATYRVGEAATRAFKETKYAVYIREFGQRGGALLLAGTAIFVFHDIHAVTVSYVVSLGIATVLSLVFLHQLDAFKEIRRPKYGFRSIYTFSIPAMVISISHPLILWTDILVLGALVPSAFVGLYEAAYQTSLLSTFALVAVSAIFPTLASEYYHSGETERLERLFSLVTKWIITFTLFVTGYLLFFSGEILFVFGAEFTKAKTTLIVLVLAQTISVATGPVNYILSMTEYERLEMVNTVIIATLNVGLNVILIREYGILGAALATATSIVVLDVIRLMEVHILLDMIPYKKRHLRNVIPLCGSFISMFVSSKLGLSPIATLLIGGVVAAMVFLVFTWHFAISEEDLLLLEPLK